MNEAPETRLSLVLRLSKHDDVTAWQEFVELYQPVVYRLARTKGLQDADAVDLSQEVLARVAKAVPKWDPDPQRGSFRGWLATITRNLVVQFFRDRSRRPKTCDDTQIQRLLETQPETTAESDEFQQIYQQQLFAWAAAKIKDRFESQTWQAFWQTAVENLPASQVAEQLSMSRGAVYVARSRVMAQLKKTVQRIEHLDTSYFDAPPTAFWKQNDG